MLPLVICLILNMIAAYAGFVFNRHAERRCRELFYNKQKYSHLGRPFPAKDELKLILYHSAIVSANRISPHYVQGKAPNCTETGFINGHL